MMGRFLFEENKSISEIKMEQALIAIAVIIIVIAILLILYL